MTDDIEKVKAILLNYIDNLEIFNFFDFMDKMEQDLSFNKSLLKNFRNEFQWKGFSNTDFTERLRVFIKDIKLNSEVIANESYYLVLLTSTLSMLYKEIDSNKLDKIYKEQINYYYGENLTDWISFKNEKKEKFVDYINPYLKKMFSNITLYIVENEQFSMKNMNTELENCILIADGLSLHFEHHRETAKEFDNHNIGGCLIVVCQEQHDDVKNIVSNYAEKTFKSIYRWTKEYSSYYLREDKNKTGFFYTDLSISDKETLLRRLSTIISLKLKNRNLSPLKLNPVTPIHN